MPDLASLKDRLDHESSVDLDDEIELSDAHGAVHAVVKKTVYVARKDSYQLKLQRDTV